MTLESMRQELFRGARQTTSQPTMQPNDAEEERKKIAEVGMMSRFNERVRTEVLDTKGHHELIKHDIKVQRTTECQVRAILMLCLGLTVAVWAFRIYRNDQNS